MKPLFFILFASLAFDALSQEPKQLFPNEVIQLDFGPKALNQWALRDEGLSALAQGKGWADLTPAQQAAIDKYGEMYESIWDIDVGGCSWYCGGGPKNVTASSSLEEQGGNNYSGHNAHDLSYQTAWVEGATGNGEGEYLLYEFAPESPRINTIIVVNGYVKSAQAWKNNSRVKKLKVYVGDKLFAILNLKDLPAAQSFEIEPLGAGDRGSFEELHKKPDWKLRFEILEVYKGDKYDDTVITEIYFNGLDVHCLAADTRITMADGSIKNIDVLRVGEEVLSFNAIKGAYEPSTVIEIANPVHNKLIDIKFDDGEHLVATADHPLFKMDGWYSFLPEKTMSDYFYDSVLKLKVGMRFGRKQIVSIVPLEGLQQTYTIVSLSRNNIFIANGILVGTEELRHEKHRLAFSKPPLR